MDAVLCGKGGLHRDDSAEIGILTVSGQNGKLRPAFLKGGDVAGDQGTAAILQHHPHGVQCILPGLPGGAHLLDSCQGVVEIPGFHLQHGGAGGFLRHALAVAPRLVHRPEGEEHRQVQQGGGQQPFRRDVGPEEKIHPPVADAAGGQLQQAHAREKRRGAPPAEVPEGPVQAQPHQGGEQQGCHQRGHRRKSPCGGKGKRPQKKGQKGL